MIIRLVRSGLEDPDIEAGIKILLTCSAPSLHTLQFSDFTPRSPQNQLVLDCAPAFRALHLRRFWIQLPASHTSVTELSCTCERPGEWARCLKTIQSCQSLQKLTLDLSYYKNTDINTFSIDNMNPILTSLVHLELKGIGRADVSSIWQFLDRLETPTLESLSIVFLDSWVPANMDFYGSLVSRWFAI